MKISRRIPVNTNIKTLQTADRLIILDGAGPLRYVDLTTNKVVVAPDNGIPIPVYKLTPIEPDTIIVNRDGKQYFAKLLTNNI